ncbi:cysteine desulfurase family protein [Planomonospora parontospora]|uniref:cysteine desulfurase family protein n=1 Tax=Planomonospora parontospora TaxID=58119 RepID=UPI0016702C41|nr:aminotransferase class V-fold PLP-dependent enzyme [Planomonospora parontospora]GGL40834.1 cysteine desulfurase [Planomonospora parontospora subsp. antibiotica]GII18209.1 cysteine desulfurase [Planomonospora parontospora subsp. antibiotica]
MSHPTLAGGPIYLDYNATTPVDPAVLQAALPYLATHFGNPSSAHAYAHAPRAALARARIQLADLLGARPEEIVFTGGGSEADTLAIRGAALARADDGARRQILTLATEHPAVLQACRSTERDGYLTRLLPVDACGRLDPADLREALGQDTALVSIAYGNSETGTLQPIPELAALARAAGALFHTDAAQAAGKVPIDVAALGAAADLAGRELPGSRIRLADLRDLLQTELERLLPGRVHLNGHPTMRLPGTLNVSIDGIGGRALLAAVPEIAAATGSACHEGTDVVSPVLTAMGLPEQRARSALRLSLGRWSTEAEVRRAAALLARAADALPSPG